MIANIDLSLNPSNSSAYFYDNRDGLLFIKNKIIKKHKTIKLKQRYIHDKMIENKEDVYNILFGDLIKLFHIVSKAHIVKVGKVSKKYQTK